MAHDIRNHYAQAGKALKTPDALHLATEGLSKPSHHERFKEIARKLRVDESREALDRAFERLHVRRKATCKSAKRDPTKENKG